MRVAVRGGEGHESLRGCLGADTLVDFVESRTDSTERARIEEHASRCESCREVLSSLARSGTPVSAHLMPDPRIDRPLAAGTRVGRYVIAHELGAGGMGVVYAAHDPELDRVVAVKLLHGDGDRGTQERLRREAQAMAQLAHPNVVAVYDVGGFGERMFIAMEHVAGETLAHWLLPPSPPSPPRSQREILDAYVAAGRGLAAAHAAGIVHRDFKPENVLIGSDGRVRVGDFGLARGLDAARARGGTAIALGSGSGLASSRAPTAPVNLTAPGTLVGTPYYMAPELYAGGEADARSDQFSFCVALFAALYGARPFDGETVEALGANVRAGRLRDLDTAPRVSRRIHRAIARGLAVDPAARFGSLHDLLAELAPRPRRWSWAIGLGTALAVGAWWVARSPVEVPDQRCTGAAAAFATAWNADRRGAVEAAFTATRAPYAAAAVQRVTSAFDQYAARWAQAHTEACRATRILGEQSEAMLELRMTCLERRRQEASALAGALATADAGVVARSVTAATGLVDVTACADTAMLRQIVAPPTDSATRAALAELVTRLADARAKFEIGEYRRALELARSIAAEARTLAYRPFEAEAEFLQAGSENMMGDWAHAETSFSAACWSAEAGRHDELAARAWVWLVFVVGYNRAEYARGLALVPRATAAIARLGGHAEIESKLERSLGAIDSAQGRFDAALAHHEKAVALGERAFGPGHSSVALSLVSVGIDLLNQGHANRAVPILQHALEIQEGLLGPDHPRTAEALASLANAYNNSGHPALGERALRRALAIRESVFGPRHPEVALNLEYLGEALDDQGKHEEAVAVDRRAVAIGETAFGPEHPAFGEMLLDLAIRLGHLGRYAEARDQIDRAEAILSKAYGRGSVQVTLVRVARADLLVRQSQWRDAAVLYEQAIPVLEKAQTAPRELTSAVTNLERAYLELHQPARGMTRLEQLASKLDDVRPNQRVAVELVLARAVWDTGGDRTRARALASDALADLKRIDGTHHEELAQIERWLAGHRVR